MTRVIIETLGCKLNQAESETLWRNLSAAGYQVIGAVESADVLILNTCTVTHIADRKARQAVRNAVKHNPGISVIVAGCYAETAGVSLLTLPNVRAVPGNAAKQSMVAELKRLGFLPMLEPDSSDPSRNRSLIKIQDGCDHRCSYCIVPLVRPVKSCVPPDAVIDEVMRRQAEGCREIVLTGTEIGEYTNDGHSLETLLRRILDQTSIERIRISSLQPQEVTPELIGLWRDRRLCRHFHLSLQSGSDSVLGRMRRRYDTARYRGIVEQIRSHIPDVAITTDIIAGFPGESEAEFEESYRFIESLEFSRLHVFPYSPRPGTVAELMPDRIDSRIVKVRVDRLLRLGHHCEAEFKRRFHGRALDVLFENKEGDEWVGYSDNYIRVTTRSETPLANQIIEIRL
ncbi:tRNA (N(6)-L-threonylcarbamoyladenosine(37)-C(2))-methylthiotransferase MtaB [Dehalogenimonas sp. THU2]|uniref:tRNA (N(6)-L-threonylcarbamoyladenosine(37)-C(2))- methylthiotransferase MtaB n=1 Tax=Dehalogenimonas sp. THU2 TaxID=3151121 RepID=UPI00321853EA